MSYYTFQVATKRMGSKLHIALGQNYAHDQKWAAKYMYIFNTNTAEILNGKTTQNKGLNRLFRKVRTYRRLWTLPLTWIVESARSFHTLQCKN